MFHQPFDNAQCHVVLSVTYRWTIYVQNVSVRFLLVHNILHVQLHFPNFMESAWCTQYLYLLLSRHTPSQLDFKALCVCCIYYVVITLCSTIGYYDLTVLKASTLRYCVILTNNVYMDIMHGESIYITE